MTYFGYFRDSHLIASLALAFIAPACAKLENVALDGAAQSACLLDAGNLMPYEPLGSRPRPSDARPCMTSDGVEHAWVWDGCNACFCDANCGVVCEQRACTDATTVAHECSGSLAAGTPCDFTETCTAYWDGYMNRWGTETWSCVDGSVVYTDSTWLMPDPSAPCAQAMLGAPTVTFRLTHLGLAGGQGFNLDGINNAPPPAGAGAGVAGCGVVDRLGGVDDGLGAVATALDGTLDLSTELARALEAPDADASTTGLLWVDVELFDLSASAYDSNVCARLTARGGGMPDTAIFGVGHSAQNVVYVVFDSDLSLAMTPTLPPTACTDDTCAPSSLAFTVRAPRARLLLDASHSRIESGSLGGMLFLGDCTDGTLDPASGACIGGSYADLDAASFAASFRSFATEAHLRPELATSILDAFLGARDLHLDPSGALTPCNGASVDSVDANALSVGFAIDSVTP